jgi:CheY-like chemotaxis protein
MKILFVDDEKFFMLPYVDAFKSQPDPLEVDVANTADEAIAKLRAEIADGQYDCLVLDVMMPPPSDWEARTEYGKFTGIEIVRAYQTELAAIELPVLLLSNLGATALAPKVQLLRLTQDMFTVSSKILTPPREAKKVVLTLIAKRRSRLKNAKAQGSDLNI